MAQRQARQRIPLELSEAQFNEFLLPRLPRGRRGPLPRLPLYRIFNYILKGAVPWLTVAHAADRQESAGSTRNPSDGHLPDLSSPAGERMFRRDISGLSTPTPAGPVARSVDHSRRRHNDCGKERRRQSRFQWRRRPSLLTPTGSSFKGSEGFCVICPPVS